MDAIRQDLRFAVRSLVRRPSFAILVVATLGLGIGAATGIFSIVDAILLRPLPFSQPERLVVLNETTPRGRMTLGWPNYIDFRDRVTSLESVAAYQRTAFTVLDGDRARIINGLFVSGRFLDVLGAQPQLGRAFTVADDRLGAEPVAIVSDRFWTQELAADPSVVGRVLRTSENTFTIVGVLPRGFQFAGADDILTPIEPKTGADSPYPNRGNHIGGLYAVGRLKPGVRRQQAQAEMDRIAADLARAYPATNSGNGAEVQLLRDRFVERVEPTLVALMDAVAFLLLLACANVANLMIARGAARRHELSIRTALGSSHWRLVQHLLAESLVLSVGGMALGMGLSVWLVKILVAIAPPDTPRLDQVSIDQMSLLFALGAAAACGLLCGVAPALLMTRSSLARASRASAAISPHRLRRLLMGAEVAVALVLLSGSALMIRTMMELANVEPGFRPDHLLTARVTLSGERWNSRERRVAYSDRALEAIRAIPGVTDAALTLSLPIEGSQWGSVFIVSGKPVPPRANLPIAAFIPVSDRYFQTMGIAIERGRGFDGRDGPGSPDVILVNQTLARRLWPGQDPVGQRLKQGFPEDQNPWREVIGVVADVKLQGVDQGTPLQVFLPLSTQGPRSIAIVARTAVDPETLSSALESAMQSVEPELPVLRILPMTRLMSTAIATRRVSAMILTVFGTVAILIAAVGLYGVASHSVTERTREIGVRMALGAERRSILARFIGEGLATAAAGTVVGLGGALSLSSSLRQLVFGVTPTDPATLAFAGALLLVVAALACYVPARRATKIDPLVALKTD
jgi:putative ABC transport system permease protein